MKQSVQPIQQTQILELSYRGFKLTIISTMLKDLVEKVDNWNELMHEEFWQKDGNHKEIENTCICPQGERVPQPEEGN